MKKNNYTVLINTIEAMDTENEYNISDYKDFLEANELTEKEVSIESYLSDRLNQDINDYLWDKDYEYLGVCKITGTIGAWDGRHEIMPIVMPNLNLAFYKCLNKIDDFVIKVWKSKIEIKAYHHDGCNHFVLRTKKMRKENYILL